MGSLDRPREADGEQVTAPEAVRLLERLASLLHAHKLAAEIKADRLRASAGRDSRAMEVACLRRPSGHLKASGTGRCGEGPQPPPHRPPVTAPVATTTASMRRVPVRVEGGEVPAERDRCGEGACSAGAGRTASEGGDEFFPPAVPADLCRGACHGRPVVRT
ncbi:hypothetical protein GCM10022416_58540 [Actinomadura keratinilytica]|uniref:Uncharacterized protein n=1 Tax=Actinomadura keratinilytica TaxID=547461 RepID=A0ABP7ZGH6_9ACTN